MKSFFQFLREASASQQAARLGLQGNGHGDWYKDGEFVAKTVKGTLKFYNKRQVTPGKDPAQTDLEKNISNPNFNDSAIIAQQNPQTATIQQEPVLQQAAAQEPPAQEGPPPVEKTKGTLTIAFGRFNPPTTGHEKLLDTVAASSDDGDYIIVPSRSNDPKKNPLDPDTKVSYMRQMFPKHSEKIVNDSANRTIFDVRIVGGADRVKEFDKLANNYNGKLYAFDNVEVRSAGERDPDAEDNVTGMSASKQRKAAVEGDFKTFRKGVPSTLNDKQARDLYNTIRASMNIKEGWSLWEIAPKFDLQSLRENYILEKIFNIGQLVENLNTGIIGRIIRRGTNYLICVTEDNIMFKSWIKDVMEVKKYTEIKSDDEYRLPEKPNTLVGTTGYLKYASKQTFGSNLGKENLAYNQKSFGLNFINKYRKK
ncbi:MAG: cytidyltransferase [Flavobacteriales bacterium]|nr:cytidyltransferase [Flavobacteriales bacterium]